jgi:hypothetical protein
LNVALFGPPGCGKGTQAELLCQRFGFLHLSTGELLRAERREATELGKRVDAIMRRGELVPDEIVGEIVRRRSSGPSAEGCGVLFDGYPRTLAQFQRLGGSAPSAGDADSLLHQPGHFGREGHRPADQSPDMQRLREGLQPDLAQTPEKGYLRFLFRGALPAVGRPAGGDHAAIEGISRADPGPSWMNWARGERCAMSRRNGRSERSRKTWSTCSRIATRRSGRMRRKDASSAREES